MSAVFFPHNSNADDHVQELTQQGYIVIRGAADASLIAQLNDQAKARFVDTPFSIGGFYGEYTKRFGKMLSRSPASAELVQHDLIVKIIERVLTPDQGRIQLSLTQALELHPGAPPQVPHRDDSIWAGPRPFEYSINVMWPFTAYSKENGATNIWAGSNHHEEVLLPDGEATHIEMNPGDALLYLGSVLHRGGHNSTQDIRRGLIVGYCQGWLKPYENQWLVYPPEVARNFSPELAALVGYRQDQPNLGNYEGQCPSILLGDDVPEYLGAVDSLRPDQLQLIADYRSGVFSRAA
jgi:ectoine hydroxylase-related dioxygenase (phytanoyl-CoA dioxygenase family)